MADAAVAQQEAPTFRSFLATIRAAERRRYVADNDADAESFEHAARGWHDANADRWSPAHAADVIESLERHVFPYIGGIALDQVTATDVLGVVRSIEEAGHVETARRVRQRIEAVYGLAIAEQRAATNPALLIAGAQAPIVVTKRHPALLEPDAVREAVQAIAETDATPATLLASRLLALTAVRTACVRGARWEEIEDLDGCEPLWRIPAERMKMTKARKQDSANDHVVPLSRQAVDVLREARALGAEGLIFRGRSGPLSDSVLSALYDRAGLKGRQVPHGWRASFSTIMNERRPEHRAAIDRTLAHSPKDKVEAAYNRAAHLPLRRELLQEWADVLVPGGAHG